MKSKPLTGEEELCAHCIFMRQGKFSCECGNPKSGKYKQYAYWCFSCPQFERIPKMNHKQKIKAGFIYSKKDKSYSYPLANNY